jgi:hypothetical protein
MGLISEQGLRSTQGFPGQPAARPEDVVELELKGTHPQ